MRAAHALLLLLIPGAAAAQTASPERSIQVVATAPSLCRMAPPTATGDATFSAESGGALLQLNDLVNDDGIANPLQVSLSIDVICSGPHNVRVLSASGGISNREGAGAIGTGFSSRLDYALQADWAGQSFGFATAGAPVAADLTRNAPAHGTFGVELNFTGGERLVAGEYEDELTVTFNPQ
ncbi:hypothetical protein N0B44_06425 [Roseibacterium beibuensis]|uniref:hypothetical protein n=1 Tax=[Roseibacterium] beibuensis TaxID=1193142 RepID=UPI00217DBE8B|nr:hypothetical protein [Roseibacterium beibuensis]MCS6622537.1 hypothetical protein [Roseibacterium beibuensis]